MLDERGLYEVHVLHNFNGNRMADHLLSEKAATSWHCFDSRMIGRLANLLSLEEKLRCRTLGAWQHNQVSREKQKGTATDQVVVSRVSHDPVLCPVRDPPPE